MRIRIHSPGAKSRAGRKPKAPNGEPTLLSMAGHEVPGPGVLGGSQVGRHLSILRPVRGLPADLHQAGGGGAILAINTHRIYFPAVPVPVYIEY